MQSTQKGIVPIGLDAEALQLERTDSLYLTFLSPKAATTVTSPIIIATLMKMPASRLSLTCLAGCLFCRDQLLF